MSYILVSVLLSDWSDLHVWLEIVFTSTSKGTEGTLVAFQACVDHHVPLPVALSFDHQTAYWALKGFPSILRRTWREKILIDQILYNTESLWWEVYAKYLKPYFTIAIMMVIHFLWLWFLYAKPWSKMPDYKRLLIDIREFKKEEKRQLKNNYKFHKNLIFGHK